MEIFYSVVIDANNRVLQAKEYFSHCSELRDTKVKQITESYETKISDSDFMYDEFLRKDLIEVAANIKNMQDEINDKFAEDTLNLLTNYKKALSELPQDATDAVKADLLQVGYTTPLESLTLTRDADLAGVPALYPDKQTKLMNDKDIARTTLLGQKQSEIDIANQEYEIAIQSVIPIEEKQITVDEFKLIHDREKYFIYDPISGALIQDSVGATEEVNEKVNSINAEISSHREFLKSNFKKLYKSIITENSQGQIRNWDCDEKSIEAFRQTIAFLNDGGSLPVGFMWRDADNIDRSVDLTYLTDLYLALVAKRDNDYFVAGYNYHMQARAAKDALELIKTDLGLLNQFNFREYFV